MSYGAVVLWRHFCCQNDVQDGEFSCSKPLTIKKMNCSGTENDFDFTAWGKTLGLTSSTLQILRNEEFKLLTWVGTRHRESWLKDADLNSLVKGLSDIHLKDYLNLDEGFMGQDKGEKLYVIPEFVTKPKTSNQSSFLWRDTQFVSLVTPSRSRPLPEQVSLSERMSALTCIHIKLMDEGRAGLQEVKYCRDYTAQVDDLCTKLQYPINHVIQVRNPMGYSITFPTSMEADSLLCILLSAALWWDHL